MAFFGMVDDVYYAVCTKFPPRLCWTEIHNTKPEEGELAADCRGYMETSPKTMTLKPWLWPHASAWKQSQWQLSGRTCCTLRGLRWTWTRKDSSTRTQTDWNVAIMDVVMCLATVPLSIRLNRRHNIWRIHGNRHHQMDFLFVLWDSNQGRHRRQLGQVRALST